MTLSFSKSVVMHEACLLLFLHRYNRDRAILLKLATTRRFSSLGHALPPLKIISSGIASHALHEKGGDLIHSIWQKGIDGRYCVCTCLVNLVCRISVCRSEVFSVLQGQSTDLKNGEISLCRAVLFCQLLKQRHRLWLEIGL